MTSLTRTDRRKHFSQHWLAWNALRHFLPSRLVQELAEEIVLAVSESKLSLTDLLNHQLTTGPQCLELWLVEPLQVESPIAQYLQMLVRAFAWQNDVATPSDLNGGSLTDQNIAQSLSSSFHLSLVDLRWPAHDIQRIALPKESSAHVIWEGIQLAKSLSQTGNDADFTSAVLPYISALEFPLSVAFAKHLGDLFADIDLWRTAKSFYLQSQQQIAASSASEWTEYIRDLSSIVSQSLAAAVRIIDGASAANEIFSEMLTPGHPPLLLRINASHDALMSHYSVEKWSAKADLRPAAMFPPLLGKTHGAQEATLSWLLGRHRDAHREFGAVLRRQFALGLVAERRTTESLYARAILDELSTASTTRNEAHFDMAISYLIASGDHEAPQKVKWVDSLVKAYVDQNVVDGIISQTSLYIGSREERQLVALELYRQWIDVIPPDRLTVTDKILNHAITLATASSFSFDTSRNVAGRSLGLLKDIATRRPEICQSVAPTVAQIVIARLATEQSWQARQSAIDLAIAYEDSFSETDFIAVVNSTLLLLASIDPKSSLWPVVRPALQLLVSEPSKAAATRDSSLGTRIVNEILRFGIEQDGEQSGLLLNLFQFDPDLLKDASLTPALDSAVRKVRQQAARTNASNATENIQALLLASAVAGREGVHDAFASINSILQSADSKSPSISLQSAWAPILTLARDQDRIAKDTGMSAENLRSVLDIVFEGVLKLWHLARDNPLLFAPFAFPPKNSPSEVIVYNWAFVSLAFAESLHREKELALSLEIASRQKLLTDAIGRAQAIRGKISSATEIDKIRSESRDTFYAALGIRLAALANMEANESVGLCDALLEQCFRQGPKEADAAVISRAISLRRNAPYPSRRDYERRVANNANLRGLLLPLLETISTSRH